MSSPERRDLTPESAAPTDIAPLGRDGAKPSHEQTAADEARLADWDAIATDSDFQSLVREKAVFIVPATIFFIVFYFALPIGVGWFPGLMETKIAGDVNLAYAFALSQFFMAWALALVYAAVATGWDRRAAALLAKFGKEGQ
ncbi:MAG: DUF485 domain-containing protein [Terrimicrobiaceae bacterium]|nr:DUF485 domain-containing protein [Terrimicrobiaceae bacterium]